nr:purple acid phosphatase 8-like isoform X2 [Physcomitrium patens]|eukprot:XP_024369236.1 purple acid phosphatase 8-like isoform X2 [Physcomitrella patens]
MWGLDAGPPGCRLVCWNSVSFVYALKYPDLPWQMQSAPRRRLCGNILLQLEAPRPSFELSGSCDKFVEFFFIDTTPFVDKYWSKEEHRKFDWRGIGGRQEYLDSQLETLNSKLESSVATWKIVVGHHTISSLGRHGDTHELVRQVLPILEKHSVDLYINGHDHCLEHIKRQDSSVHFITSGAGSKSFQGIHEATPEDGLQFAMDGQGFISVSMAVHELRVDFHDALGHNLHKLQLTK